MSTESTGPEIQFEAAKILVVDDVPSNIQVLGSALRAEGYQIIPATNGEQALRTAETAQPDLILLDVMMPEMNGHEAIKRLREIPAVSGVPVIFVTALTDDEDEETGLKLGAVDYITKPINFPITLARVRTHLNLRFARKRLENQNQQLIEAARLREDMERMSRHDLKNPIQVIVGTPALIEMEENLSTMQADLLKRIKRAGYNMLEMINRSLDLYKMETGVYKFQPEAVNILAVIGRIMEETEQLAKFKQITTEVLLGGAPPGDDETFAVWGEELLCYSMLANLIKNAIEASPEGERITVRLERGEEQIIRIHNMGAVPEEIRSRFFDKYATSGKEQGTGLGTYSARLIAGTQGGTIGLETSEESGTTLTVILDPPQK